MRVQWAPARVAFVGALIATVTFDGLSGSDFWATRGFCVGVCLIALACWLSTRRQRPAREQS